MWLERFVIIVTSLHRDFLPSSWGMYYPTRWDFMISSARSACSDAVLPVHPCLPMISISEVRALMPQAKVKPGTQRTDAAALVRRRAHAAQNDENQLYGLMAEFDSAQALVTRPQGVAAGYRKMEAYTPLPIQGLNDASARSGRSSGR